MLDNLQNREREFTYNFFKNNPGIRLVQLGLALYFLEHDEKEWVHTIARDTIQDYEILGPELFHKTMNSIFSKLKLEGPSFWEDSDRGNINIYYTPYKKKIDQFREIQDHYIQMQPKPARVIWFFDIPGKNFFFLINHKKNTLIMKWNFFNELLKFIKLLI